MKTKAKFTLSFGYGIETDTFCTHRDWNKMNIPINTKGRILSPKVKEPYIIVQDDLADTGGYFILTSNNSDFTTCYDGWVLKDDLEGYFEDAGWEIEWLGKSESIPADVNLKVL